MKYVSYSYRQTDPRYFGTQMVLRTIRRWIKVTSRVNGVECTDIVSRMRQSLTYETALTRMVTDVIINSASTRQLVNLLDGSDDRVTWLSHAFLN